jgi:hypothetical protein
MAELVALLKLLAGTQLPTLLALCVLAALGVLAVVLYKRKWNGNGNGHAILVLRVERLERDMEKVETSVESIKERLDDRFSEMKDMLSETLDSIRRLLERKDDRAR